MSDESRGRAHQELAALYDLGPGELRAARYFKRQAQRGADLSPVAAELEDRLHEAGDVRVIRELAVALCRHWVEHEDLASLGRALDGEYIGGDVRAALVRSRYDLSPVLPLLVRRGAVEIIAARMARKDSPWSIDEILDSLCREGHAAHSVPRLVGRLAGDRAMGSEAVSALADQLASGRRAGRRGAAGALRLLAREHGRDLAACRAILERALDDPDREVRVAAAGALAHGLLAAASPRWERMDALLTSRRALTRATAADALLWAVRSGATVPKPHRLALLRRLVMAARAVRGEQRERVVMRLLCRASDWPHAEFQAAEALIQRLGLEEAADHFRRCARQSVADARRVLQQLEQLGPNIPAFLSLARLFVAKAAYSKHCQICATVPRREVYTSQFNIPEEVRQLAVEQKGRQARDGKPGAFRCPSCGAFYTVAYEMEIDVCSYWEEWKLERLTPTRALDGRLQGELLAQAEEHFEGWLDEYQRLMLGFSVPGDVPWALTEHWLAAGEPRRVAALLQSSRSGVSSAALAALEELAPPPKITVALDGSLRSLLRDPQRDLRARAGAVLMAHLFRRRAFKELVEIFSNTTEVALAAGLNLLIRETAPGDHSEPPRLPYPARPLAPLLPRLARHVASPHEDVRRACQGALYLSALQEVGVDTALSAFHALLEEHEPELRKEALDRLTALSLAGHHDALPTLAGALDHEELCWQANHSLTQLLHAGRDLTTVVPAYVAALSRPGKRKEPMLHTLSQAVRQGTDVTGALAAAAALCKDRELASRALELMEGAHDQGLDLTSAEPPLLAALNRRMEPYLWEAAARILVDRFLAGGRWAELTRLLRHRRHHVRGMACDVLSRCPADLDITPVVPALEANLDHPSQWVRRSARAALKRPPRS